MNIFSNEKRIRSIFVFSVELKAINAILEIVLGTAALFTNKLVTLIQALTQNELIEDPNSIIAHFAQHLLHPLAVQSEYFISAYLLSHGIVKLVLAIGLLRKKLWAYPSAIVVFTLFIVYQIYHYTVSPSYFLIFLTIFDAVIIVLTWHEYRYLKNQRTTDVSQTKN